MRLYANRNGGCQGVRGATAFADDTIPEPVCDSWSLPTIPDDVDETVVRVNRQTRRVKTRVLVGMMAVVVIAASCRRRGSCVNRDRSRLMRYPWPVGRIAAAALARC